MSVLAFGAPQSSLKLGEVEPCELIISIATSDAQKAATLADFTEYARLRGNISHGKSLTELRIRFEADAEYEYVEKPEAKAGEDPLRFLPLSFHSGSFVGVPPALARLLFKAPTTEKIAGKILEILLELKIKDEPEAKPGNHGPFEILWTDLPRDLSQIPQLHVSTVFGSKNLCHRPYRLTIDEEETLGMIPESGLVAPLKIPKEGKGKLEVQLYPGSERWETWEFEVAEMLPATELKGAQSRLLSQGFDPGELNGELDGPTMRALTAFQQHYGLVADGTLNADTACKLEEVQGC